MFISAAEACATRHDYPVLTDR